MAIITPVGVSQPVTVNPFDQIQQLTERLALRYASIKDPVDLMNINTAISILAVAANSPDEQSADRLLSAAKRVARRQITPVK